MKTLSLSFTSGRRTRASGVEGVLVETEYNFLAFPVGPIIGSFDDVVAVPEPSMMSLIGRGVGGLVLLRRRRPA